MHVFEIICAPRHPGGPPMPATLHPFRPRSLVVISLLMVVGVIAGTLGAAALLPALGAELAGHYAELQGVKMWFVDTGGPGTPVVLLHANTGTAASWEI